MNKTLKTKLAKYATKFVAKKTWRNFDDFETIGELCREIVDDFDLPFSISMVTGEDAYMYATFWSDKLAHSIIIDHDWYISITNSDDFVAEIERTWQEYEHVKKLLAQLPKKALLAYKQRV